MRISSKLFSPLIPLISLLIFSYGSQILAKDLATAKPERSGMSSTRLERINSAMQGFVDEGKLAGIVTMISRRGKVVHFEKFGKMDLETGKEMQLDTLFRIYSMSKPIVTVAAMSLYEEGRFQLNDPISKYMPEFKETKVLVDGREVTPDREITVKNLMSHTAGLTYGFFGDTTVDRQYREAKILANKDLEEMVGLLARIPLQYQPGSRWHYSVAVDVLGRFIEVIAGMPLDEFLQQRVFDPLEMEDTFFEVPKNKVDRFGTNHRYDKEAGKLTVMDSPATSQYTKEVTFFSGGGGLISTATDYMRFCQMMLNGGQLHGARILSPKTIELMTTNHLTADMRGGFGEQPAARSNFGFGLGFGVLTDLASSGMVGSVGSYNWGGAAGTIFWIDPKEDLAVVTMIQIMGGSVVPLRSTMQVLTYGAFTD